MKFRITITHVTTGAVTTVQGQESINLSSACAKVEEWAQAFENVTKDYFFSIVQNKA